MYPPPISIDRIPAGRSRCLRVASEAPRDAVLPVVFRFFSLVFMWAPTPRRRFHIQSLCISKRDCAAPP
jgi:hypothetical protein